MCHLTMVAEQENCVGFFQRQRYGVLCLAWKHIVGNVEVRSGVGAGRSDTIFEAVVEEPVRLVFECPDAI